MSVTEPDFTIRKGDTGGPLETTLLDDTGQAVNLTAIQGLDLRLADAKTGVERLLAGTAEVVSPATGGKVRYLWDADDTDLPGLYLAEWRVTFADGSVQTFPNGDAIEVGITEPVDDLVTGDLLLLAPELKAERADFLLALSTRIVRAFLEPETIPDPTPAAIELVILRHALALNRATPSTAGAIVSESLGTYTYRLARPLALDDAFELAPELKRELMPWAPKGRRRAFDVAIGEVATELSVAWWQADEDSAGWQDE